MEANFDVATMDLPWEKLEKSNVLVTGANGLIASDLVESLLEVNRVRDLGLTVWALCRNADRARRRFSGQIADPAFNLLVQDVTEPLLDDVVFDYVVHAASSACPSAFNKTPVDVMRANFNGTLNLLEMLSRQGGGRFMFISSSEVYGENFEGKPLFNELDEGHVDFARFRACYPESKRASETLCMSFRQQFEADIVIVRPAFIYGREIIDSNDRADASFMRSALAGEDIVMYSRGDQIRSYLYVKDCSSALLYTLLLGEGGGIYNIGDATCAVSLRDYASMLAHSAGVDLQFNCEAAPQDTVLLKTTRCVLDDKALRSLGWTPFFNLETGLADIFSSAKAVI